MFMCTIFQLIIYGTTILYSNDCVALWPYPFFSFYPYYLMLSVVVETKLPVRNTFNEERCRIFDVTYELQVTDPNALTSVFFKITRQDGRYLILVD